MTAALLMCAQLAACLDTWVLEQVNLVLVLVLEALHLCDQVAARRQTLPLLPPASLNYACNCLLPLLFLRRPPRRCAPGHYVHSQTVRSRARTRNAAAHTWVACKP